jgi:hypothetical protein
VSDPLKNVEDKKGQTDVGVLVVRVFQGALFESDSWRKAFWATAAFCYGMLKNPPEDESE